MSKSRNYNHLNMNNADTLQSHWETLRTYAATAKGTIDRITPQAEITAAMHAIRVGLKLEDDLGIGLYENPIPGNRGVIAPDGNAYIHISISLTQNYLVNQAIMDSYLDSLPTANPQQSTVYQLKQSQTLTLELGKSFNKYHSSSLSK